MTAGISKSATKKAMRISTLFVGVTGIAAGATGLAPAAHAANHNECTGVTLQQTEGWLPQGYLGNISFWSAQKATNTCIGTVEADVQYGDNGFISAMRVRIWHDGTVESSTTTGVTHHSEGVTGATTFRLWVSNPVNVCVAFLDHGNDFVVGCKSVG